jgi:hypothetical protein
MQEAHDLSNLVTELCVRYPNFKRVTIDRLVARTAEQYQSAAITAYVPVLVRRQAVNSFGTSKKSLTPNSTLACVRANGPRWSLRRSSPSFRGS